MLNEKRNQKLAYKKSEHSYGEKHTYALELIKII